VAASAAITCHWSPRSGRGNADRTWSSLGGSTASIAKANRFLGWMPCPGGGIHHPPCRRRFGAGYLRRWATRAFPSIRRRWAACPASVGLRIPVATVVGMVADGMTRDEILAAMPDLVAEDIQQALQYARGSPQRRWSSCCLRSSRCQVLLMCVLVRVRLERFLAIQSAPRVRSRDLSLLREAVRKNSDVPSRGRSKGCGSSRAPAFARSS
jgi:hypothetical protein